MLSSRKVKGMFKKYGYNTDTIKNTRVNGQLRGCYGFVCNPKTDLIVYINTESSCYQPLADKILYRYAKSTKDYTGDMNRFCTVDEFEDAICDMLNHYQRNYFRD